LTTISWQTSEEGQRSEKHLDILVLVFSELLKNQHSSKRSKASTFLSLLEEDSKGSSSICSMLAQMILHLNTLKASTWVSSIKMAGGLTNLGKLRGI